MADITQQFEQQEQKLIKDYEAKISRQAKSTMSDVQLRTDTLKEEIYS